MKSLGGRLQYCAEASPPPLQSCSKDFGSLYFVLAEGFLACLLCTLIFSRRFLGFDSCFESTAPWLSWCKAYTLVFSQRFHGFDSCFESTAPWLSYCVVYTLILGRRFFFGFDSCFESTAPLAFLVYSIHFSLWTKVYWLRLVFRVDSPLAFLLCSIHFDF